MRGRQRLLALAAALVLASLVGGAAYMARAFVAASGKQRAVLPSPAAAAAESGGPGLVPTGTAGPASTPPPPTAPAAPATRQASPAPAGRAPAGPLWGLWEPRWQAGDSADFGQYTRVETSLGHRARIVHWFASWTEGWDYDGGLVRQVLATGRTPMITWEAWDRPLTGIAAGRYDAYVDSWARGMAASRPQPIYLRIFHEFNDPLDQAAGSGYPWGVGGGTANRPADLVAAWRHVRDRFVAAGASNVRFVWSPDGVNLDLNRLRAAYPGDAYVDFAGWDAYGYDTAGAYQALSQVARKPFVLAEVGSTDPAWVHDLAAKLRSGRYGMIRAVVWFNEEEWRLDANPGVGAAVRSMLVSFA